MSAALIQHFRKLTTIEDEEVDAIVAFFKKVQVRKKENLLDNGNVCRSNYFVIKGCLRMFFINEKGVEQTTQFAIENWWIADYMSYQSQGSSDFCIQAVEKSDLMVIDFNEQERLMLEFPAMERYFRMVYQKANAASQMRVKFMYDYSKEDQYRHFTNSFPDFTQRIPQYLLASYLNFTPEYLSEIRKKVFLKPV
ncbi:Crp/Fnr family transcriptional regulator [Pedobacter psychroterrae]|uniref:Crp/Fnr family transcriptional regulator n=1 Tax=Pedobacter psychroterrae TaxID=2530453 RepID=A0A4R0NAT4_9SPHI|nr:Crp/Fnr family transcriptional regulator [Pedobacter psychroterrae]TCC97381.1 Crp/Fnr family transcriptional regulator [Pedobacter psychroterrae]